MAGTVSLLCRFPIPKQAAEAVGRVLGPTSQWNAYSSNRMVQMPMTPPRMSESRRFLRLILCIRLLTAGKRLARVFILLWMDLSIPLCEVIFSFVAIAMLIVSSIRRSEFRRWSCSFRNSSVLLLFTPDPLLYDSISFRTDPMRFSLSRIAIKFALVLWNSCV